MERNNLKIGIMISLKIKIVEIDRYVQKIIFLKVEFKKEKYSIMQIIIKNTKRTERQDTNPLNIKFLWYDRENPSNLLITLSIDLFIM